MVFQSNLVFQRATVSKSFRLEKLVIINPKSKDFRPRGGNQQYSYWVGILHLSNILHLSHMHKFTGGNK